MPPTLSVVIVSWNVSALLKQSLSSIYASWGSSPGLEVIVVDNASSDDSANMVRNTFPDVKIIPNTQNRGYPAGCNQGMQASSGQYLLILNPDTEIVSDALATMCHFMDNHPQAGITGPLLIYPDGTHQSSRRRFPTLSVLFLESNWFEKYAPQRILSHYYVAERDDTTIQQVDWITGAAMLVRREVYKQIGGMDEGFFMYSEELDWCRRIKENDWQVIFNPEAVVIHHEGKSSEQVTAERHIYFQTSRIRYTRIYHSAAIALVLRHWLRFQYLLQIIIEYSKFLFGNKRDLRRDRIHTYIQVLQSRFQ